MAYYGLLIFSFYYNGLLMKRLDIEKYLMIVKMYLFEGLHYVVKSINYVFFGKIKHQTVEKDYDSDLFI